MLEADQSLLDAYVQLIEDEEYFDNESGVWVKSEEREYEGVRFYAIPAEILNSLILEALIVTESERKELMA